MKSQENDQYDGTNSSQKSSNQSPAGGNERQRFIVTKENYWSEKAGTIK